MVVVEKRRVVSAVLPNGVQIGVEAVDAGGSQDVSRGRALDLGELGAALEGMATLVKDALVKVAPDSAEVEFGMDVKVESGKLTALLVGGSAGASLKITLGWGGDIRDQNQDRD
ncbi:CU044_2847 family protein [Blastococcus montanus]|uniref:CU044_2847 family protein n=1 Tax=Blastococcus montanus TaxID=3144973 RepID=UPI00320855CC